MREDSTLIPSSIEQAVENREQHPPRENSGVQALRNKILRCLGLAASLIAVEVGQPSSATAAENEPSIIAVQEKKESVEQIRSHIEQVLKDFDNASHSLTKEEILEYVSVCRFLKNTKIKIIDLDVPEEQELFSKRNMTKEILDEAIKNGVINPKSKDLQILRVDFSKLLIIASGVYLGSYNVILVPVSHPSGQDYVKQFFGAKYYSEKSMALKDGEHSKENFERLRVQQDDFELGIHSISDVPNELVEKYGNDLIKDFHNRIRTSMRNRAFLKAVLPHEAFHYFFNNFIEKDSSEYSGPNLASVIKTQLEMKKQRFGEGVGPHYGIVNGSTIDQVFERFHLDDEQSLQEFSEFLAEHIKTHPPDSFTEPDPNTLSEPLYLLVKTEEFIDEALARSAVVAGGYTKEKAIETLRVELEKIGEVPTENEIMMFASDQDFPILTVPELTMFEQMQFQGSSAFLREGQKAIDDLK